MGFFYNEKEEEVRGGRIAAVAIGGVAAIVLFISSLTHVPVGSVGVQTNMSRITGKTYSSGWYFKTPFAVQVHDMSIRQQTIEYDTIEGELAGKELINMNLKLVYSLNSDKAAYVYENYGENYIDTLMPRDEVFDVVKATVAQYDIEEVRSSRDGIMTEARDALQARFGERGVTITSLALSNYNFGDLEASINAEVQAKQERKTVAEQKALELEKAQADQEIKEAQANADKEALLIKTQADADAKKIAADGEAYQKKTLADAEAYAIQKAKEEITPEYVEWQKWQKWNGSWQVIGTDGSTILSVPAETVQAAVENSNGEAQPSQGE